MLEALMISVFIVLACMAIGFVIEKRIVPYITRFSLKSKISFDNIIVKSFLGMFLLWSFLVGAYISLVYFLNNTTWLFYAEKIIISCGIISVTLIASRIATDVVKSYSRKAEGVLPSTSIFSNLTRILVFVVGAMMLLEYLGIPIAPILTALGVGGLAVALALQDTLSNIFAGIQILLSRQLRMGDFIRLESGEEGFIMDISWRNTSIRTMANSMILVPNSKLSGVIVINHDLPGTEISVLVKVGVSYSSDLEHVERIAVEVASQVMAEIPGGIPDFKPVVRYNSFSDSSIDFNVVLRSNTYADQFFIKHEFIKLLHKRFQQENIEIPFPIRTVHMVKN